MTAFKNTPMMGEGVLSAPTEWDRLAVAQAHPEVVAESFSPDYRGRLQEGELQLADQFVQSRRHLVKALEGNVETIFDTHAYGAEVVRGITSLCADRFVDLGTYGKQPAAAIIKACQTAEFQEGADKGVIRGKYMADVFLQHHREENALLLWAPGESLPNLKVNAQGFVACRKQVFLEGTGQADKCDVVSPTALPGVLQSWTERLERPVHNFNPELTLESRLILLRMFDDRRRRNYRGLSNYSSVPKP